MKYDARFVILCLALMLAGFTVGTCTRRMARAEDSYYRERQLVRALNDISRQLDFCRRQKPCR